MKTILIYEGGEEVIEKYRLVKVEVPDDFDEELLEIYDMCFTRLLHRLANEAAIEWVDREESEGVYPLHCFIEENEFDAEARQDDPAIQITDEMLNAADEASEQEVID